MMEKETEPELPCKGHSLEDCLGFVILPTDTDGTIHAEMMVDHRTCQPYGYLSGGASMALAETLAGHGSLELCTPDEIPCGIQISGNHLMPVRIGNRILASGKLLHRGHRTHIWDITLNTESGETVSSVRVVNYIVKK